MFREVFMKFRRLMAASMAGVMAVSSSIVCQVTASAATMPYVRVKGNSKSWAMNVDYACEKTLEGGTKQYTLTITNTATYGDSFDGGALKVVFSDPDKMGTDFKVVSVTTASGSVVPINGTAVADPVDGNYIYNGKLSPYGVQYVFTDEQLAAIGDIAVGESISIIVEASVDGDKKSISSSNFTYSTLKNENMKVGDSITITYDSTGTPDNAKYHFKYKVAKSDDSGDFDYYAPVYDSQINGTEGADATGLTVTSKVDGTKTIYTFTAVKPSTNVFAINVETSATGNWDDTAYLWFGECSYLVSAASVDSVKITAADGSAVNTEVTFGDEITLKADVTPADADGADKVEWSSNDPDVAEVSTDGKISFKKAGKVVITAKAGGKSDSVTFNVAKKTFTYNGGWNNVTVDGTKDLDTLLKAEADSFNIIPASSPYVSLVNGKDYTASAQVAADKKSYDLTVKLIGDAADNYELTNPTFKGGYIYYHMSSMALNKTSLNLVAGGKGEALTAVTTPDNALLDDLKIIYESTDPTVATVDSDGNVTPVKAGTATIKVTATANAIVGQAVDHVVTKTAECQVTVTNVAIPATKIHLDAKEKTLTAGDKTKLTATVTPADSTDSVTWRSSAESVAAVDKDGNVTAKAAGTATITATAGEYSAECTVIVKAKEPDIVPDDNKYTSIPKTSTKIDSVATTINSDGTRNMLAVFYISDEDAKACDMLAVTIQRQDGKEFSKKLYLENFFDSISYTNGDKIYQGSAKGSNHYVAMKFLNVDPEWGSITIKIEPIIAKG